MTRRREAKRRGGTHFRIPASSIFNRFGMDLRDEDRKVEGLTVLEDWALSVLELVTELKREEPSFFVMVANRRD